MKAGTIFTNEGTKVWLDQVCGPSLHALLLVQRGFPRAVWFQLPFSAPVFHKGKKEFCGWNLQGFFLARWMIWDMYMEWCDNPHNSYCTKPFRRLLRRPPTPRGAFSEGSELIFPIPACPPTAVNRSEWPLRPGCYVERQHSLLGLIAPMSRGFHVARE